jgi:hypothetical protein
VKVARVQILQQLEYMIVFLHVFCKICFLCEILVSPQRLENSCDGFKSSSLASKRITGLFLYVFHHCFFVHWEVTGVSCIKYIGECFVSTPSELIGLRKFFSCFLHVLGSLGRYRFMGRIQSSSLHESRFSTKRST